MNINVTSDTRSRMSGGDRNVTLCRLFFLLVIFGGGQASTCSSSDRCPANRPRDTRGCCPRLQGESCGYVEGEEEAPGEVCDSVLGYECRGESSKDTQGTCQGSYNLQASDIEQRTATLTWDDFIPADYALEYSLLRTTDTYKPNISDWMVAEIGQRPRYNVEALRPGTWYFFRVGVWEDMEDRIYANLTEIIAFPTKSVAFCEHDEVEYPVGQTFNHNCEDTCTCMPEGEFECVPLCDIPELPDPERCKLERYNESCCALRVLCEPIMADCADSVSEREFEHGEEFETECSLCVCNNGTISCDYTDACEKPDSSSCPLPQEIPVAGECCPQWRCGNGTCEDDGETFNTGDTWRKESTCQSCNCTHGSITCLDLCEEPIRPENCSRPKLTKIEGSCCEVIECLPPENECFYESQAYTQGSYLTNTKCELCVCADNSTVVCTPKQCGVVTVPSASIFCPHPHIRKDGCCDTLWCENPDLDMESVIKSLFGTSYSPHSVTLSFMEDKDEHEEEETAGEDTQATYELQYSSSNNVTDNDTSTWQKRTFVPKPVHSEDEPVTSPSHFLQTTGAIRVGKRVYVTVSGMEANTTYYLKVLVISSGFHDSGQGGVTSQPPQYAGAVAVRTLAEEIDDPCPTTCHSEEALVVAAPSCPKPKLIKLPGVCCPVWKCYPEEGGCHYKNLILKNGEQIREHCERKCVCRDGNVTCTPVCGQPGTAPRQGCNLETLTNHCCPVWMCPPRTRLSESISVVINVEYRGTCKDPVETFSSRFKQAVLAFIRSQAVCLSGEGLLKDECDTAKVTVACPKSKNAYRRRRDIDKIRVDLYLTSNVSSSSADAVSRSLAALSASLAEVFNATNSNITMETVYMRVGPVIVTTPTGNCDPGFIFDNNVCVEGVTPTTSPTTLDVPLHVSATSTSALLAWQSLRTPRTQYVTGLQIEYQEVDVRDFFTWNQTDPLEASATSHKLTSLQAARGYRARLVVFTNIMDNTRVRLKPIKFETKPFALKTVSISIQLQEVSVSVTSVTLRWAKLPDHVLSEVGEMVVRYTHEGISALAEPALASKVKAKRVTSPSSTSVTVSDLLPATAYVGHLAIFFKNNTMGKTGTIHFVTMTQVSNDGSLVIALVVSAVVVVCAVAIVIITCFLWRRSRQREARETAFENKTFGLHIENDGRTLSARP